MSISAQTCLQLLLLPSDPIFIFNQTRLYVYTHTHTYMHTHTHTHTNTHTHTHSLTLTLTLAFTHSCTHTHARTHTRTHTHTQTNTNSHTHICFVVFSITWFADIKGKEGRLNTKLERELFYLRVFSSLFLLTSCLEVLARC